MVSAIHYSKVHRQPEWTSPIAADIVRAANEAHWITPADDAAVKTATQLAVTYENGHPEVASALMSALSLLGLTPIGRQRIKAAPVEDDSSELDAIRAAR